MLTTDTEYDQSNKFLFFVEMVSIINFINAFSTGDAYRLAARNTSSHLKIGFEKRGLLSTRFCSLRSSKGNPFGARSNGR